MDVADACGWVHTDHSSIEMYFAQADSPSPSETLDGNLIGIVHEVASPVGRSEYRELSLDG